MQKDGLTDCGMFSLVGGNHEGDKFDEKIRRNAPIIRNKGANFKTAPPAQTLGKFQSLYVNDPYVDKIKAYRQRKNELAKKNLNPRGFVMSSPSKISSGQGDYFGTFQQKGNNY